MLEILDGTRLQTLQDGWRDLMIPPIDYHPNPTGAGADYFYYDRWCMEKVDRQKAWSQSNATPVDPDDIIPGWIQNKQT